MKDIYFSHDIGAFSDPKLRKLRGKYGMEGYGIYWALLEALRREDGYRLDNDDEYLESLAYDFRTEINMREFVDDCIRWGLFDTDEESFFSPSLIRRTEEAAEKKEELSRKRRAAINQRWHRDEEPVDCVSSDSNAMQADTNEIQIDTNDIQNGYKTIQGDTSKSKSKSKRRTTSSVNAGARVEDVDPAAPSRNVAEYLRQAGVDMTPGLWEELRDILSEGITTEMVCMAVDDAIKNGACGWGYIAKILNRWIVSEVRTVEDVKRERAEHERRSAEKDRARFQSGRDAPPSPPEPSVRFL